VRPHEIRNANGPAAAAALREWGFAAEQVVRVSDRGPALRQRLRQLCERCDVVLLSGGLSVGKYDLAAAAIRVLGARVRWHGVAMKPGKPSLHATLSGNRHIFGLPGPSLSALTALHEFALPAIRRLAGLPPARCRESLPVRLAQPLSSKGGRIRLVLAAVTWDEQGLSATPLASRSSADLASAAEADGVLLVPPEARTLNAGARLAFRPWRPLP
jgi:molybdenum cofactor synthesis domain-containing protein